MEQNPFRPFAQFAPVAPVHILRELVQGNPEDYGAYHLYLAHHTVEKPDQFKLLNSEFVHATRDRGMINLTVIMDNSLVECGGAVSTEMVLEATKTVLSSPLFFGQVIPVLPDVMGDSAGTIDATVGAYATWCHEFPEGTEFMLVTQGENFENFAALVNHFFLHNDFSRIRWVGIPRKLTDTIGTREDAVKYIQMVAPHVKIHLLGFSKDIHDDLTCARMPGVRGIDSAVPVRYDDLLTPMTAEWTIGPRGDWFEKGKINPTNLKNIRNVRQWIG